MGRPRERNRQRSQQERSSREHGQTIPPIAGDDELDVAVAGYLCLPAT